MQTHSKHKDFCYLNTVFSVYDCAGGMSHKYTLRIIESVHAMQERLSKMFVYRFDLHQNNDCTDNRVISELQKRLFKKIDRYIDSHSRSYKAAKRNRMLLWAREQETAGSAHFHCGLLLDGNLFNTPYRIEKWIKDIWKKLTGGHVPAIPHPYYNLNRRDLMQRQKVIYRLSYLAKLSGKRAVKGLRYFGSGQMRPQYASSWNPNLERNNATYEPLHTVGQEWISSKIRIISLDSIFVRPNVSRRINRCDIQGTHLSIMHKYTYIKPPVTKISSFKTYCHLCISTIHKPP